MKGREDQIIGALNNSGLSDLKKGCIILDYLKYTRDLSEFDTFQIDEMIRLSLVYLRSKTSVAAFYMVELDRLFMEIKLRLVYETYSDNT